MDEDFLFTQVNASGMDRECNGVGTGLLLVKGTFVLHLEGFGVKFGIDAVVVIVLGDEEFGVGRQVALSAIIVERSRVAMRDGEIRILFNFYSLLPLPDEGGVYLPLLAEREAAP